MSLSSDVTFNNLSDFYQAILPYLNVGNGGTSDTPLGQMGLFEDVVAPAGWLVADGTVYNISDYPDLANHYNRVYGAKNHWGGNGTTTFAVPDWQGEVFRAAGTNSHPGQGNGGAVGEHQDATRHVWVNNDGNIVVGSKNNYSNDYYPDSEGSEAKAKYYSSPGSTGSSYPIDYTSRMTNTSLLCCVKAVPSSDIYTYSLTERRAGTTEDGDILWERTFTGTTPAAANTDTTIITLDEGCNIVDFRGMVHLANGTKIPFNFVYNGTVSNNTFAYVSQFRNIQYGGNSAYTSAPYRCVVQYTKASN